MKAKAALSTVAPASASLDKASYNKGDLVTLTVVDPGRTVTTPVNVPTTSTAITVSVVVTSTQGTPTATSYVFTQKSDNPATGTSVWTTTA